MSSTVDDPPVAANTVGPESFRRVPWKNGLGTTLELATDTPASDGLAWSWRLSLAEVPTAGPFSQYPGIDRHLACLDGAGLSLVVTEPSLARFEVPRGGLGLTFPGETHVAGEPLGPGVRDANLMVRRGVYGGALHLARPETLGERRAALRVRGDLVLVYAHGLAGVTVARETSVAERVPAGHLARFTGPCEIDVGPEAVAVVAVLWRVGPTDLGT